SKAMFAVCAVSEGGPFIYEDQDLGLTDFIARLMQLRSKLMELRDGDADYLSVQVSDNSIFAVHRFAGNRNTVALVNLSGETKTVKVKLPEEWDRGQGTRDKAKRLHKNASGLNTSEAQVGDAWSGKVYPVRKGIVTLTLQPFEVALLTDVVRARKFALKTENQKAGFPVSQTSPEFRSGSSPTLRVTSASKPVSLSDEGFMSAGKVLTGQWHEGEFKIAPGERMPFEVAEVQRNEKGASGKLAIKRKMGATVRTVAEILWSWTRDKKLWRYEAKLQVKLPIKLARHDLAWQFNFVKPKRWRISTVEGVMEEQTIVRHERPQLILDSSKVLLSPTDSPICVQLADGNWWTLTEWRGANLQVWLQPDETLV
ncbi:MAG: hypothetical protein N2381_10905, partial [Armatimonadetes bacterium]|nr:hypothetical protein [Armatimonadota bacterium]